MKEEAGKGPQSIRTPGAASMRAKTWGVRAVCGDLMKLDDPSDSTTR